MNRINSIFYMYSSMDKSSQILLFLIILVSLMLISIFVINMITKKKNAKYDSSLSNITRYSKALEREKKHENAQIKNEVKEEEETDIYEIEEDPEIIEVVSHDNSIEEISKMIENTLEQEPINLTAFEEEQEKDAIISYDELVKRAGAKKIVYKVETKEEPVKEEEIETIKEKPKTEYTGKFKTSQIISPIYGIQKEKEEKIDVILDVEDYLFNKEKNEDIETMDDIEFLGSLKTFRSNLD